MRHHLIINSSSELRECALIGGSPISHHLKMDWASAIVEVLEITIGNKQEDIGEISKGIEYTAPDICFHGA